MSREELYRFIGFLNGRGLSIVSTNDLPEYYRPFAPTSEEVIGSYDKTYADTTDAEQAAFEQGVAFGQTRRRIGE